MEQTTVAQNGNIPEIAEAIPEEKRVLLIEMGKAGVFYGRKKSKTHPKMKPFIFGQRNGVEIIDGMHTLVQLERAAAFLVQAAKEKGKKVIVVGTHPAAKNIVEAFARAHNCAYVTGRWVGGTLTNFKVISGRIEHFKKLKADRDAGRLDKYTKKERVEIDREIGRMAIMFGGLENLGSLPSALLVIDARAHDIAIQEAVRTHVPIVALMNTDGNPDDAEYPIPANTNSRASIEWILNYLGRELSSAPATAEN